MKIPSQPRGSGALMLLASALLVATGCAHRTASQATEQWSTEPIIGIIEDADIQHPVAVQQEAPQYPFDMRRAGITGVVHVNCLVDETGRVADATAVGDSNYALTESALHAVKRWSFSPGTRNGIPVPMRVSVPVVFSLQDQ